MDDQLQFVPVLENFDQISSITNMKIKVVFSWQARSQVHIMFDCYVIWLHNTLNDFSL